MKMIEHHIQLIIFQKQKKKDYNVMIDGKNLFDQPINSKLKTYENLAAILLQVKEMITQLVVC